MPVHYNSREAVFEPETIQIMATAYEDCIRFLQIADRTDPLTEIIAKEVVETARLGVREPTEMRRRVVSALRKASSAHPRTDFELKLRNPTLRLSLAPTFAGNVMT